MPQVKLNVRLLSCTPSPEEVVAMGARLCYSDAAIDDLLQKVESRDQGKYLEKLMSMGHLSPIEHASFTFGIEGVSRALLAQITRHRIASFSVQSQRYVDKSGFDYVLPPEIEAIPEAKAEFIAAMEEDAKRYERLRTILIPVRKQRFMDEGMDEAAAQKAAEKAANEDARFVLPNACDTRMIVTMNVRSLYNFFRLRCCNRAQWEIRAVAVEMLKLCRQAAPLLFKNAGPACLSGPCAEGAFTCGKLKQVRESFREL